MEQYYEMIITDKKRIPLWSCRLHLALKAYQVRNYTHMIGTTYYIFREIGENIYHILGASSYSYDNG